MNDEQTVVNGNDPALQAGEQVGAQDELDSILAQYDEANKPQGEPKQQPNNEVNELLAYFREEKQTREKQEMKSAISEAVSAVKKQAEATIPDRLVRGFLHDLAVEDPRINKAFSERKSNPEVWNQVLKSAAKQLQKELQDLPDANLSKDRDLVTAAVRSASTAKPTPDEAPDFSKMNKSQLDSYLRNLG